MTSTTYSYLALALLNISISLHVLRSRPQHTTNRIFAAFGFGVAIWIVAIGFAYDPRLTTLVAVRTTFAASALMLLALFCLFHVFPAYPLPLHRNSFRALSALTLLFTLAAFTPLIVVRAKPGTTAPILFHGPLYKPFTVYVVLTLFSSIAILFVRLRRATGFERLQLRYLLLALLLPGLGVATTNLLLPLITGASNFGRYGPAFSLAFLAFTAHALVRQRLLDTRLVVTHAVSYILAALLTSVALLFVIATATLFFPGLQDLASPWSSLLALLPLALAFHPVKEAFRSLLGRYFYRPPLEYAATVRNASRQIGRRLDPNSLISYLSDFLEAKFQPEHLAIYLTGTHTSEFRLASQRSTHLTQSHDLPRVLPQTSSLPIALRAHPSPLLAHEAVSNPSVNGVAHPGSELRALRVDCALPLSDERGLLGFILLGPKLSGDPYFQDDLDLLATLASPAAIAFRNGVLYLEVRRISDHLHSILSTMESAVLAVDSHGRLTLFNAAASRFLPPSANHDAARHADDLPSPLSEALTATLADGHKRLNIETSVAAPPTGVVPIIYSTAPLRTSDGHVIGASIVFSDISKLKQLELDKRKVEHLAAVGSLAAGIAHEIKNPLVAIRTFAELLPDRYADTEFRTDFARLVLAEIERIAALIDRLRGLAHSPLNGTTSIRLDTFLEDALTLLHGTLEQNRIVAHLHAGPGPLLVQGDSHQLQQLFLNLLINSVEAMPNGGSLDIILQNTTQGSDNIVQVQIKDSGVGLSQTVASRLFEPFYTTKRTGSGLGLAICRSIAEAHQAALRLDNNPSGLGAIATVDFLHAPLSPEAGGDAFAHDRARSPHNSPWCYGPSNSLSPAQHTLVQLSMFEFPQPGAEV